MGERQHQEDSRYHTCWLPLMQAYLELARGNPAQVVELLENTDRYSLATSFHQQYLRGLAYLKLGKNAEAAAELVPAFKTTRGVYKQDGPQA